MNAFYKQSTLTAMRGPWSGFKWLVLSVTGLLAVSFLGLAFSWPTFFDAMLATQMQIKPGSRAYKEWVATSVPIYFDVYMFNWTNADQFPNETPHVEEVGPFRFRETRYRVNITWNPNNDTVGYRTFRSWHYEPDISFGDIDANITMPNVVAASAIYRSRNWNSFRQNSLSMGLNLYNQKISVTKPARQLLFDGYPDEMLEMAMHLPSSMTGGAPKVDKFGWFYQRNNSIDTDGYVEVSTGVGSGTLPGQIMKWNHEFNLTHYSGECAKLEGSAGEFIPRNMTPDSELVMFVADLCRPLHMQYTSSGELEGLPYHTYAVNEMTFDNSSRYHDNSCFCNGPCSWGGVMNVSACRFGAPAFVSLPHFLHADPALRRQVTGLQPNSDKHEFYFSIEPKLGIPVDVAARFQLNILIQPNKNVDIYENIPELLFPILWVEQHVTPSTDILLELRVVRNILDWGGVACAMVALILGALVCVAIIANVCSKRSPQYAPPEDLKDEEMKLNPI